jgi:hypothetical protein
MKIKEYLDKFGVKQTWFAQQLGITSQMFNHILAGRKKLPKKYWTKIILISNGHVHIEDLIDLEGLYEKFESEVFHEKHVRYRDRCELSVPPAEI